MDVYFFYPRYYDRYYNCSAYSIGQVPAEKRQHPIVGIFFLAAYAIFFVSFSVVTSAKNPVALDI